MRQLAIISFVIALLVSASSGDARERGQRSFGKPDANPSAIVAAELSFARLAREKGQWTAFRETAADDAVMFVPNLRNAQDWLKGKADPPSAVEWQPHKIVMSCDGSMAVSTGAWQGASGKTGSFVTIWRRKNFRPELKRKRRGKEPKWKWVFDHGVSLEKPLEEPDFIETEVAKCQAKKKVAIATISNGDRKAGGQSADGTLVWTAIEKPDGLRKLAVTIQRNDGKEQIIDMKFPAAAE